MVATLASDRWSGRFWETGDPALVPSDLETYLFPLVTNDACPAGTFELEFESGRMSLADGLYKI
ncbi:hypothetical protein J2T22_001875 [Pseudarthrobacter defluvii]|uniref:Uncharacterized protein n=1 Tax=Pseudarthrobacter defluvii TaxID=410837 RepID=A0ABT9UKC6_9MICC|nr:hypothetical protein [Pseudarthrobacter defluvii]